MATPVTPVHHHTSAGAAPPTHPLLSAETMTTPASAATPIATPATPATPASSRGSPNKSAVSVDSPAGRYQGEASFLLDRKQKILTHLRSKVKGMDQDEWLYRQPIGLPPIAK